MQRGTSNSGACLNARCEQNLGSPMSAIDIKYLYRFIYTHQRAQPVLRSRTG